MAEEAATQDATVTETSEQVTSEPNATTPAASADWKSSLPEDIRGDETLKNVKSVTDLARMNIDAQRLVGAKGAIVPGTDATQQQWDEFYGKVGRPTTPGEYQLKPRDEKTVPAELLGQYAKAAHGAGLTTKQANELLAFYEGVSTEQNSSLDAVIAKERDETVAALQKEYGNAYESRVQLARAAVRELGGAQLAEDLERSGWGNSKQMVGMLVKIGGMLGEDRITGAGKAPPARTPEEASEEIRRLQADDGFMKQYKNSADPNHKQAVEQMRQLFVESAGTENRAIEQPAGRITA